MKIPVLVWLPLASITVLQPMQAGLVIVPTFDSSITGNPNAAEIEATIYQAIRTFESSFTDPVRVSIYFRYSSTGVDGHTIGVAHSNWVYYPESWNTYISALTGDAKSANDSTAHASLPGFPLSPNVDVSSANGRALGLNTPGLMQANGWWAAAVSTES